MMLQKSWIVTITILLAAGGCHHAAKPEAAPAAESSAVPCTPEKRAPAPVVEAGPVASTAATQPEPEPASPTSAATEADECDELPGQMDVVEEFWPDGKLQMRKFVYRLSDGRTFDYGLYETWLPTGVKQYRATYICGKLQGVAESWHPNGERWTIEEYKDGLRHGTRVAWDDKGRKRQEEHYYQDLPDGTWTIWEGDGRVKWQGHFDKGRPLP